MSITSIDSIENSVLKKIDFKEKNHTKKSISKEALSISEALKKHGYLLNRIDSISTKESKSVIFFKLNHKINKVALNFPDLPSFNKTIVFEDLERTLKSIAENEEKKGFAFSEVALKNIRIKKDTLYANIEISRSKKRIIDKTIIKGYPKLSKKKIKRFFNINEKSIFNSKKTQEISNKTKALDFVSEIKPPEILFKKDSTLLYLYLKKTQNSTFDGIINFTSKEDDKGLLFTGHLKLDLNNILNGGERFYLKWEANGEQSQNFTLSAELPYIFNSPLTAKFNFKLHKQDTIFTNNSSALNVLYNINTKLSSGISYTSENSLNTLVDQTDTNLQDFKSNCIGFLFKYTNHKENNFFSYLNPSFGKRITNEKTTNQFKFSWNNSYYHKFNIKSALLIKNEGGLLLTPSEITNELFRIGGANSIRGFNEESIFTSKYSFINLEYHYYTATKSYFYSITDFGLTRNALQKQQLLGIGLGFSFASNKNRFNIATALGKTNETALNLNNAKIILSFITVF